MKMTELFLGQLEREAAISRRALASVPDGKADWRPHPKSMPFGYLATLVATMPSWIGRMVSQDALDLNPTSGPRYAPPQWATNAELLKVHEDAVAQGIKALRETSDEHLMTPWRLLSAGKAVMENPRHVVLGDTFGHLAHHRGQLTVYLRLNEVPVPSIYGPTADDAAFR
jgi:uncharacterized damage-inducible protein DinB